MSWRAEIDRRLQLGPAMRVQRIVQAGLLLVTIFSGDFRLAYLALALTALEVIQPRLALVALVVALFKRAPNRHRLGDLYFDLGGSRGAAFIATVMQCIGLALATSRYDGVGRVVLAMPTASFLLSPTLGFCAGCWFYVVGRDVLARVGLVSSKIEGARDVSIDL